MKRFLLAACCALLALPAWAQTRPIGIPTIGRPLGKPPPGSCGARPAECQIHVQVFDFGRGQMSPSAPAINGHNTVSVTCVRSRDAENFDVDVQFVLKALPGEPNRFMRDSQLAYLRYYLYVDAARTRYWGDGYNGTQAFPGALFLDNRNKVGTLVFPVYGKVEGGQAALPGQWLGAVVTRLEYDTSCR
jgi:spore coat protein U-like protein